MRIFDTHTHIFPEKIAAQALAHLRSKAFQLPTFTEGTAASLLQEAQLAGISGVMNCPVVTNPGQMRSVNSWVASLNHWPLLCMGGIHPAADDLLGELQRLVDLGLHGVKLHPEYQEFTLLEKRMEPIWNFCEQAALPVLLHAGIDIAFPVPAHSSPADFAELVRRHPGLVLIAAHLGGWRNWDLVERDLLGHPVYLDTSFSMPYMPERRLFKRLIQGHGSEYILFGTDSPWQSHNDALADLFSIKLPDVDLEKIFWGNAARIFHLDAIVASA